MSKSVYQTYNNVITNHLPDNFNYLDYLNLPEGYAWYLSDDPYIELGSLVNPDSSIEPPEPVVLPALSIKMTSSPYWDTMVKMADLDSPFISAILQMLASKIEMNEDTAKVARDKLIVLLKAKE